MEEIIIKIEKAILICDDSILLDLLKTILSDLKKLNQ